jgi:hypothetical protein
MAGAAVEAVVRPRKALRLLNNSPLLLDSGERRPYIGPLRASWFAGTAAGA